jgi:hypothetical protein
VTAITGSVSGCSTVADWRESQIEQQRERIPRLCRTIDLTNHGDEPHAFHVLIERDGEIVSWWTSEEIPPRRTAQAELGSWHWDRGEYVIYASYDDYSGTSRRDLSEREFDEDDACILIQVRIVEEGRIGVFTTAQEKDEYVTRTEAENQSN